MKNGFEGFTSKQLRQVGQNIYLARFAAGLTQVELAKRIGFTQQHLGSCETGYYRPGLRLVFAVAYELGVPVAELFREEAS